MSTEMFTTTNVVDMPVEQVTEAIVAAAKRVRKPKAEISIVEQIVSDILAGKFAEEAAALLKQIFGDEFCIKKGLMEKPKKTRKPKAPAPSKVVVEGEEEKPKVKKARKPKAATTTSELVEAPVVTTPNSDTPVAEEKPKAKKVRKPTPPKETVEAPVTAPVSEAPVAEEKPKAAKKVRKPTSPKETVEAPVAVPISEVPVITPTSEAPIAEEKPKEKKVRKPTSPKETVKSSEAVEVPVTEEKPKEKKVRKPKKEIIEAPVLEKDEFSENWGKPLEDELVEEELSDIEEEE